MASASRVRYGLPDDTEIRLGPVPIRFRRLDLTVSTQTLDASHVSRSSKMITNSPEPIAPGTTLGHYVICVPLGVGGMGEVYEAEDTRLHRRIALKVIRRDVAADPVRRARLEREATAVAMLNHPHIVTVYSLEEHQSRLFITMELVDGSTLADALPERAFRSIDCCRSRFSWPTRSTPRTRAGIIHRDLKPANIMITRDGVVKVLDFGLSRIAVDRDRVRCSPRKS